MLMKIATYNLDSSNQAKRAMVETNREQIQITGCMLTTLMAKDEQGKNHTIIKSISAHQQVLRFKR